MRAPATTTRALQMDDRRWPASGWKWGVCAAFVGLLFTSATGFGASQVDKTVTATVDSVISIIEPTAAVSTSTTEVGAGANQPTFTAGSPPTIAFLDITGNMSETVVVDYEVTTNNPNGYELTLENASGTPSVLTDGPEPYPDMPNAAPAALDLTDPSGSGITGFGVAIGLAGGQASVDNANTTLGGGYWGVGASQGTLFRGVPAGGILIGSMPNEVSPTATRVTVGLTHQASGGTSPYVVPPGSYAGTLRFTATAL